MRRRFEYPTARGHYAKGTKISQSLIDFYENLPSIVWKSVFTKTDENQAELSIVGIEPKEFDIDKELNKIYFINSHRCISNNSSRISPSNYF